MSKTTLGPWKVGVQNGELVILADNEVIARIEPTRDNEIKDANARLIAAAPEMYDVLQDLIAALERYDNDPYQEELPDWRDAEKLLARIDEEEQED